MLSWLLSRPATVAEAGPETRAAPAASITRLAGDLHELLLAPSASGITVTPTLAMRSPTFSAVARVLSESIGSLPWHLYRRGPDGARSRETAHPVARLLSGDWTPWSSSVETRTQLALDVVLHGEAFARVVRAGRGDLQRLELHRLQPGTVTVEIDRLSGEPSYRIGTARGEQRLSFRDMLHVRMPGSAIDRRVSLVDLCREAIGTEIAIERYVAGLFAGGGRPSGLLTVPAARGSEAREAAKAVWSEVHRKAGGVALLDDGSKFTPLTFSSVDMQTVELKRLAAQQIAGTAKVPLTLIGNLDRAVWRNIEELNTQYVQHALLPHLEMWKAALERVLLMPDEREFLYIEAEVSDLLRGDLASRFAAYRTASGGSWMTANEIRSREDMPPIAGGDQLVQQAGQTPASGDEPADAAEDRNENETSTP